MEDERRLLDNLTLTFEKRSGITVHTQDKNLQTSIAEYAIVKNHLHKSEVHFSMMELTLLFQLKLLNFLLSEEQVYQQMLRARSGAFQASISPDTRPLRGAFLLLVSQAESRLDQFRLLMRRIQIQLGVVRLVLCR